MQHIWPPSMLCGPAFSQSINECSVPSLFQRTARSGHLCEDTEMDNIRGWVKAGLCMFGKCSALRLSYQV